jgi:hypothetical protein
MTEHYINPLTDFRLPLSELKKEIEALIDKYGEDAIIFPDAGYNNVEIVVITG